jgi:hypothetical protein
MGIPVISKHIRLKLNIKSNKEQSAARTDHPSNPIRVFSPVQQVFPGDTLSLDLWDRPVHKLTLDLKSSTSATQKPVSHALDSLAPDEDPGASAERLDHSSDRFTTMRCVNLLDMVIV